MPPMGRTALKGGALRRFSANAGLLAERIDAAMLSLRARRREIQYSAEPGRERHRVERAMHMLDLLRATELGRTA